MHLGADLLWSPEERPATKPGDVWIMGQHRLACGDSTHGQTVRLALDGATPHLMVTDPPYGVEYDPSWRVNVLSDASARHALGRVENDDRADWRAAWSHFAGHVAYVWHGALHGHVVHQSLTAQRFEVRSQIVWDKGRLVISRGHYHWRHEACWYAVRKGATAHWNGDRSQSTVWQMPHPKSETGHSTQKPIRLMQKAIENSSAAGDTVYDPFLGSGTTLLAAEVSGRICIGVELSPAYVDLAVLRWERLTGRRAMR